MPTGSNAVQAIEARGYRSAIDEWEARVELAACFRLAALYEMTDLLYGHFTLKLPGPNNDFLINPLDLMFHEITASSLVKLDFDGNATGETERPYNWAGYVLHAAVHKARPDARCVLHTHTEASMAVSAQREGLLPISQAANYYYGRIAYYEYDGPGEDMGPCEKLIGELSDRNIMILRNHGLLTCGETPAAAFGRMLNVEKACRVQIAAQAGGRELIHPPADVCEQVALQREKVAGREEEFEWPALLRQVADRKPDYAR